MLRVCESSIKTQVHIPNFPVIQMFSTGTCSALCITATAVKTTSLLQRPTCSALSGQLSSFFDSASKDRTQVLQISCDYKQSKDIHGGSTPTLSSWKCSDRKMVYDLDGRNLNKPLVYCTVQSFNGTLVKIR